MATDKRYPRGRNAVKCLTCGIVIESKHAHDFVVCACGINSDTMVAVDGGYAYIKMSAGTKAKFKSLQLKPLPPKK